MLLIPAVVFVLASQREAKDRLASYGIAISPALGASVGIAAGGPASGGSRIFGYGNDPRALIDFYRRPAHRPGWTIIRDSEASLILGRGSERISISAGDDTATVEVLSRSR